MNSAPKTLRILLIEDNPGDARLIEEMLKDSGLEFKMECVDRLSSGIGQIKLDGFDVILLDLGLPDSQGLSTLMKLNEIKPEAPVIVLTGLADETIGTQAVKEGAQDYLIKGQIDKNLLARSINYAIERAKAEEALRRSEEFNRSILESVDEGFIIIDRDYRILTANRGYADGVRMPVEDIIGKHCYEISHHLAKPCYEAGEDCAVKHVFETGESHSVIHTHYDAEGNQIYVETKAYTLSKDESGKIMTVIEILIDITEERKLENQLRQSQKMEAIGQLTGGIAHDFNNRLTAIIGYAGLMQMKMQEDDPLKLNVDQILASSERAAHLTHSLLAFSRKQVLNPKTTDLNNVINNVVKLLKRVIGEDIELEMDLLQESLTVMADSMQIEQVLMNLAINARDAMPKGGQLTIETKKIELDEEFIKSHGYGEPGAYVLMSISDNGVGMDEKTRQRIFEPFFTTKEVGKGTGLGLAMVYGIIKQHNGYINVYSEPDKGTTFKIYLSLVQSEEIREFMEEEEIMPSGGTETILLAEDDESVRKFTVSMLHEFGYNVIEAVDGEDAVNKFMENKDKIRLLFFDMIMPKKSGNVAYKEIRKVRPDMKVLFSSGYTADTIQRQGLLDEGLEFISKPTAPTALMKKIRQVLDK